MANEIARFAECAQIHAGPLGIRRPGRADSGRLSDVLRFGPLPECTRVERTSESTNACAESIYRTLQSGRIQAAGSEESRKGREINAIACYLASVFHPTSLDCRGASVL